MRRIFGHYVSTAAFTLGAAEALLVTAIFCSGIFFSIGHISTELLLPLSCCVALVMVAVIQSSGLHAIAEVRDIRRSLRVVFWITVPVFLSALLVTTYLTRHHVVLWRDRSQWALGITIACMLAVALTRIIFVRLYAQGLFSNHIFVIGDSEYRNRIRQMVADGFGNFEVMGELDTRDAAQFLVNAHADIPAEPSALLSMVRHCKASEIVILQNGDRKLPWNDLLQCKLAGIRVTDYPRFCERERQLIDLQTLSAHWFVFADGFHMTRVAQVVKRAFDILVCMLGIVIVAPVFAVAAIAIKLESKGPVLYRQERVGLNGRSFTIFKFRSMAVDAEKDGAPRWADAADDRITRVGAILRKFRIDELPQFFNVLRGDMSFIGPRPERPYFVDQLSLEIPYFRERHAIKPGITGWAQVSYKYGASVEDARHKLSFDLYYLKNQSLFLDLIILIRTVRVIVWPTGVH